MLDLRATIDAKDVTENLSRFIHRFPGAISRGLDRIGGGLYQLAYQWLSGPGAKKSNIPGGGYPVPVRTGHLRQSLDWLDPGESKSGDIGTVTAALDEVIVFDSASYAPAVFLGLGSSAKYGPRDALRDALYIFNHGGNIERIFDEEIRREINRNA